MVLPTQGLLCVACHGSLLPTPLVFSPAHALCETRVASLFGSMACSYLFSLHGCPSIYLSVYHPRHQKGFSSDSSSDIASHSYLRPVCSWPPSYTQLNAEAPVLCKPKLMPLKSASYEKQEAMSKPAVRATPHLWRGLTSPLPPGVPAQTDVCIGVLTGVLHFRLACLPVAVILCRPMASSNDAAGEPCGANMSAAAYNFCLGQQQQQQQRTQRRGNRLSLQPPRSHPRPDPIARSRDSSKLP